MLDGIENILSLIDYLLNTDQKRHVTGGVLLSVSIMLGGLALTVMTIKKEENEDEQCN